MINWFGPASWSAAICLECPRCDIPVGHHCERCDRAFTEHDKGITMPMIGGEYTVAAFHLDCHLKSVLPHHLWEAHHLTPDPMVERVDDFGTFTCWECKVQWSPSLGWTRL